MKDVFDAMVKRVAHSKQVRHKTNQTFLGYLPLFMELDHVYGLFPKIKLKGTGHLLSHGKMEY